MISKSSSLIGSYFKSMEGQNIVYPIKYFHPPQVAWVELVRADELVRRRSVMQVTVIKNDPTWMDDKLTCWMGIEVQVIPLFRFFKW